MLGNHYTQILSYSLSLVENLLVLVHTYSCQAFNFSLVGARWLSIAGFNIQLEHYMAIHNVRVPHFNKVYCFPQAINEICI